MLSRHANELHWMARHIERAENTARLLDVTYRTSLLPYEVREAGLAWADPWSVPLITMGLATSYYERHPELTAESALRFMILDPSNTSSIHACLRAITSEMYEDLNSAWIEMRAYDYERIQSRGVSDFLDWVKMRSHLFRGVTFGTMLRDEAYHFIRLGRTWNVRTTRRVSSTPSTTSCCRRLPTSAAPSITTSGRRCCSRYRASSRIARSTATSSPRGGSPSC
jgi:uncharacterized alpha-E superfamily protein